MMRDTHIMIVGGTHGAGRELVSLLSGQGAHVSVLGRRPPGEDDAVLSGVRFYQGDLTDRDDILSYVEASVRDNGPINGIAFYQRYRGGGDDWTGEIAVSLTGTRDVVEAAVPYFAHSGPKSIVMISSIAGQFIASEQSVSYHLAKAGVERIAAYYAVTLGREGIRVNCVRPGTMLKEESKDFYLNNKSLVELYEKLTPLGRMGSSLELAKTVRFLLSDDASFITGQILAMDGGVSLQWPEGVCREIAGLDIDVTRNGKEK